MFDQVYVDLALYNQVNPNILAKFQNNFSTPNIHIKSNNNFPIFKFILSDKSLINYPSFELLKINKGGKFRQLDKIVNKALNLHLS